MRSKTTAPAGTFPLQLDLRQVEVLKRLELRGSPDWGYGPKGHPTLRARVEFLLEEQGVPGRSAQAQSLALAAAVNDLEEIKHGRTDAPIQFVIGTLMLFEALIIATGGDDKPAVSQAPARLVVHGPGSNSSRRDALPRRRARPRSA
jgi:hypothetical protein